MNKRWVVVFVAAVICAPLSTWSQTEADRYYSTCPDSAHAVVRSVAYKLVTESELIKWATVKVYPKKTSSDLVSVWIQVEGERGFCAEALGSPVDKQKAAVDAALQWRFRKNRGDFNDDVAGTLSFRF
jgi:hypothetical protein